MTWTNIWVKGAVNAMDAFLDAKKIEDADGGRYLPHGIFVVGPIYPMEQTGVDEDGNPVYGKKAGTQDGLWCFSVHDEHVSIIDELKVLNNPNYTVLEDTTLADMQALYPDYNLGQGIPHIAEIQEQGA